MFRKTACAFLAGLILTGLPPTSARADSEPYIGDVMMVGFNFCPRGWAMLEGQILGIAQNEALFSLLGTTYGGDGVTTFALPDMRGRTAMNEGTGPGLTPRAEGQKLGADWRTLLGSNLPSHGHVAVSTAASTLKATTADVNSVSPADAALAEQRVVPAYASGQALDSTLAEGTVQTQVQTATFPNGGSLGFPIAQPSLGIRSCIALFGVYPSRN